MTLFPELKSRAGVESGNQSILQNTGREEGNLPNNECGGFTHETKDFHLSSFFLNFLCYVLHVVEQVILLNSIKVSYFFNYSNPIFGKCTCINPINSL